MKPGLGVSQHGGESLAAVTQPTDTGVLRTVRAAENHTIGLDAMSHDAATAMVALRRKCMNRTFETIERVRGAIGDDFKGLIVIVSADFTA